MLPKLICAAALASGAVAHSVHTRDTNPAYFKVNRDSEYGAPAAPSYSAPAPSYSAPEPSYSAPEPSYSAPAPSYSTPSYPSPSYHQSQPTHNCSIQEETLEAQVSQGRPAGKQFLRVKAISRDEEPISNAERK